MRGNSENKDGQPIRLDNQIMWLLGIAFALGGAYFLNTMNYKDVRMVKVDIKSHETRIATVEANMINIDKRMESMDKKLDVLIGLKK